MADRAAAVAHSHPSPIELPPEQSDLLTTLLTICRRHWDMTLTDALQNTALGTLRLDPRRCLSTHSPNRALDTAITRLRIGHTRLNAHLHRLRLTDSPDCPWCPTQQDTPEHLLLHCPRHHSHRVMLLHSLSALHIHRPTVADLLGGTLDLGLAFRILKFTRVFLKKSDQLHRI